MRIFKLTFLAVLATFLFTDTSSAQFIKSKTTETKINWQNLSFEIDGVYGSGITKAQELLKNRKAKKEVVVAIIGPGIDIEHEDLQGSIWLNREEKKNDKDGYINDLNGWNYLGNTKGEVLEEALSFGDQEFFRLKDLYAHIQSDGIKYYTPNADETVVVEVEAPEDKAEYEYFMEELRGISPLASKYGGVEITKMVRTYSKLFDKELREKYPDKQDFTVQEFLTLKDDADTLRTVAMVFTNLPFSLLPDLTWNSAVEYFETTQRKATDKDWEKALAGLDINPRAMVGDNPYSMKDVAYGNDILLTENAGLGTLYAGVIGAQKENELGINGISDAKLMVLRTNPNKGDAFMKDIARAIYYAVDNGADIIQLSSSSVRILPYGEQKVWVEKALAYAASKNILIVQPVVDASNDMDQEFYFPSRKLSSGKVLQNMLTVAASDMEGNPLIDTNFGVEALDLFAPGKDIYSTYTGDTYRSESGSGMAASVVTGVAALLKSYFPDLTGQEIRSILMESVTDRSEEEVEKQAYVIFQDSPRLTKDLFLFEDLCASGGILSAEQAVKLAEEKSK